MSRPAVSAVIPAWNAAAWVGRAIRSALAQEPAVDEVIVADDGSTDGTAAEAERFGGRVRVLRLPHRGQAATTNAGLLAARGDWVGILHADDEWLPEKTAVQTAAVAGRTDAGIVYCDLALVRPDGSAAGTFLESKRHAAEGRILEPLLRQCFVLPSAALIRRRLVADGLRFPEDLVVAVDYEFWLRAARRWEFVRVDRALVRRALRPDAAGTRLGDLRRDHVVLFRRLRDEIAAGDGAGSPALRVLDRRLAGFEIALGLDRYRAGEVAEARRLLGASLRRRPSARALGLYALALAGRPGRAAVAAARGWR
jgi:glycosyltransferase involved in cell wall biosynthesis